MDSDTKRTSTKQKILDKAIYLFAVKGFTETSIRELAMAVGIKEASIYNHFPSKHAILEYILEEYRQVANDFFEQDKLAVVQDTLKSNPTAEGILSCFRLTFPREKEEYFLKQLYVILQEQYRNPLVREFMCKQFILGNEDAVRTVIDKLKECNVLRPDTNPDYWVKIHSSLLYAFASRLLLGIGDQAPDFAGMGMREMLWTMYDMMLKACCVKQGQ